MSTLLPLTVACDRVQLLAKHISRAGFAIFAGLLVAGPFASSATLTVSPVESSIVNLQPSRSSTVAAVRDAKGDLGVATLINLNPRVNSWWLLELDWGDEKPAQWWHLENPVRSRTVVLTPGTPGTVVLRLGPNESNCILSFLPGNAALDSLPAARATGEPFAPLCTNRVYLRNSVAGHSTKLEAVSDFLRDHTSGGENLITFVKKTFYQDAFLQQGTETTTTPQAGAVEDGPLAAQIEPDSTHVAIAPSHLGLKLDSASAALQVGEWYPVHQLTGVYFSTLSPGHLDGALLHEHGLSVSPLGRVESAALVYLVAFDLSAYDLHYALGTDHPRLGWSSRALPSVKGAGALGPDGIDSAAPLARNGAVNPDLVANTIATFTAGFKREHGAFRYGPFSLRNEGSHYGFAQEGVTFSRLQPGLATVFTTTEGDVHMGTWDDQVAVSNVRDARQNGVPLVQFDPKTGQILPGAYVNKWGEGNWSGSAEEDLQSLRAGLCLQESGGRRYLIFGYFSDATPSAMAQVFRGYHCSYAMHLDMNALEHTYLALYPRLGSQYVVEHLIEGMAALDTPIHGQTLPRFLLVPDDRDFFYLTRKSVP